MTNTPWEASSGLYKKLAIGSIVISATGIILALIGANSHNRPLMYTALGIIGVGLVAHLIGMTVRARDARAWRISQGLVKPRPPKRNKNTPGNTA
ncbi:hypothetical protein FQ154_06065 [Paeniglutamicibacter gangotriensis]|uniref:DUF3188 domain-containing protein n=1 Tax=Paeniglutamicibacter gangotriensis TaxID=254787 RepID=A0A5B0EFX9_9MICC|nr:hypothetical protein [Paeniglutamicibacter gangotriensis]KAA0977823.1 hypothetical protein FQ154_06065 [Paeniglutamicibacter gangotriensis]